VKPYTVNENPAKALAAPPTITPVYTAVVPTVAATEAKVCGAGSLCDNVVKSREYMSNAARLIAIADEFDSVTADALAKTNVVDVDAVQRRGVSAALLSYGLTALLFPVFVNPVMMNDCPAKALADPPVIVPV